MPASINTSAGIGGSTATLTTGSVSPGGINRLMLAAACGQLAASAVRSGGSGGDDLTQITSDISLLADLYAFNVWFGAGPSGSTTAWADFDSAGANALSAIYLEDVDQGTSLGSEQTAGPTTVSTVSSTVATITVTGLTDGQPVVAALGIGNIPDGIVSVVAGDDTNVFADAIGDSGERHAGVAWLFGFASGTTATLSATITAPGIFNDIAWVISARPVNSASAGAAIKRFIAQMNGGFRELSGGMQ